MSTIIETVLDLLYQGIGAAGSVITIFDYLKNRKNSHVEETKKAIREQSKKAYDSYCEYRGYRMEDLGEPLEKDILGYWESCLQRDVLPGAKDMVSEGIASREEAEILSAYLLKSWMEIPDFAEWLHDVLTQNKLEKLSGAVTALQENFKSISRLAEALKQQDISNIAVLISPERIVKAKRACTDLDRKNYYMVDIRFETMFRVISAGYDVPHKDAVQRVMELAEGGYPVIIAGNGGFGKTSLMMRAAVQWASEGKMAVWLSLSDKIEITPQKAGAFWDCLTESVPAGQRALVCIDNPYGDKVSFSNLQKKFPGSEKIQLIMAERANRLTMLADSEQDYLKYWFDDARMVVLQGLKQFISAFQLKDYESRAFPDTPERRKKILEKCVRFFVKEGIIKEKDSLGIIGEILKKYDNPAVSTIELIYRTLFVLQNKTSKTGSIILDWEEWGSFIEEEFGKGDSYTRTELYGVIAALSVFKMPTPISLFTKYFELNDKKFRSFLKERFLLHHREPVIFRGDALLPKHDLIAELFFLFQDVKKTAKEEHYINSIMYHLLKCMNVDEIETFLDYAVKKNDFNNSKKYFMKEIAYRDYMDIIYDRVENRTCNLTDAGKAHLCLGYLWSVSPEDTSEPHRKVKSVLNRIAPGIDGSKLMAVLYTEWGIWARNSGDKVLAEEKYRSVVDNYPEDVQSRTELGKLLSGQRGRAGEAEEIFREVIEIDKDNIQSRTELGKLISRQKRRQKEAEKIFREALKIDPKNLHPHTELGILLSGQGRNREAEEVFREAMRIDARHVHSRTELGKLLSKQDGREMEAEEVLLEALQIEPEDVYAMKALARLYEQLNRHKKAAALYREVQRIQSKKPKRTEGS